MAVWKWTVLLLMASLTSFCASADTTHIKYYQLAFEEQQQMLRGEIPFDFRRAVFITENSYYEGKLKYADFKKVIAETGIKLKNFIVESEMSSYKTAGQWAAFTYMTEKLEINNHKVYTYDFEDYFGEEDYTKMFVTKLMKEKNGNCHSLPYLYKILCDEIGVETHLAITPNHVYIKHISEKGSWTNVELTNASFPKDKWIVKDFEIPKKAVENKLYMQPLSNEETLSITLFDLANAYDVQFGVDSFYLSIVDTALSYFPHCVPLLMNKANYYTELGNRERKRAFPSLEYLAALKKSEDFVDEKIRELGHRGMSKKMYAKMVRMMAKQKVKHEKRQDREDKRNAKKKDRQEKKKQAELEQDVQKETK